MTSRPQAAIVGRRSLSCCSVNGVVPVLLDSARVPKNLIAGRRDSAPCRESQAITQRNVPKRNSTTNASLALLGLAAALLAWRIVVTNMAELHLQSEEKDAARFALSWDKTNAQALFSEGLRIGKANPAQAITYLSAAIRNNPTDGPSYAAIARLKEDSGDLAAAEKAMQAAAQMAPRRVDVQLEAARFWFRRGEVERAMKHMDVVLTFGDSLRDELFPDLLKLAEDPATREIAHAKLLKQRVAWLPQFFSYAAANATNVDTLRALFQMQAAGPNIVTTNGLVRTCNASSGKTCGSNPISSGSTVYARISSTPSATCSTADSKKRSATWGSTGSSPRPRRSSSTPPRRTARPATRRYASFSVGRAFSFSTCTST